MFFSRICMTVSLLLVISQVKTEEAPERYTHHGCFKLVNSSKLPRNQLRITESLLHDCLTFCASKNKDKFALQQFVSSSYVDCSCPDESHLGPPGDITCWFVCNGGPCGGPADHYTVYKDTNECALTPPVCDQRASCKNLVWGYNCTGCPGGYVQDQEDSSQCIDLDECSSSAHNCAEPKQCLNKLGSFECCNSGYKAVNDACQDVDECASSLHNCTGENKCLNREGSFECCENGYYVQNELCQDINECLEDNGGCPDRCQNTPGSFKCTQQRPTEAQANMDTSKSTGSELRVVITMVLVITMATYI